jgi:hypothetical protein
MGSTALRRSDHRSENPSILWQGFLFLYLHSGIENFSFSERRCALSSSRDARSRSDSSSYRAVRFENFASVNSFENIGTKFVRD